MSNIAQAEQAAAVVWILSQVESFDAELATVPKSVSRVLA